MAAYLSVSDLKQIRGLYESLSIQDSTVLNQVNESIKLSHFDSESIEEIQSIVLDFQRSGGLVDSFLQSTIGKINLISELHQRSQKTKIRLNSIKAA